mgnify:CR=1 FL=1
MFLEKAIHWCDIIIFFINSVIHTFELVTRLEHVTGEANIRALIVYFEYEKPDLVSATCLGDPVVKLFVLGVYFSK